MLLTMITGGKGSLIAYRVLAACTYLAAALLVWDYITFYVAPFVPSTEGMPVRTVLGIRVYVLLFGSALAGAGVLAVSSIMVMGNLRLGTFSGLLGCLLESPWVAVGLRDITVPHLPLIGYRIHYDAHFIRAECAMIAAIALSFLTLHKLKRERRTVGRL